MQGLVLKAQSGFFWVKTDAGVLECTLRGRLKKERQSSDIAVIGDIVEVKQISLTHGAIEAVPLPDGSVDVVISNCVVNLSTDKPAVLREAYRVLVPGGRLRISDVVAEDHLSAQERVERGSWAGCIAGALSFTEYRATLAAAGFTDVSVTATHAVADGMHATIVRATRPPQPRPAATNAW